MQAEQVIVRNTYICIYAEFEREQEGVYEMFLKGGKGREK